VESHCTWKANIAVSNSPHCKPAPRLGVDEVEASYTRFVQLLPSFLRLEVCLGEGELWPGTGYLRQGQGPELDTGLDERFSVWRDLFSLLLRELNKVND
jgi:hypothetical protein